MGQEHDRTQGQTLPPLLIRYLWATGLAFGLIAAQMFLSVPGMWTSGTLRYIVALGITPWGWAAVFAVVPVLAAAALLLARCGHPAATSAARATATAAAGILSFWLAGFVWAAAAGSLTGPTAVGTFALLCAIHWYMALTNGRD